MASEWGPLFDEVSEPEPSPLRVVEDLHDQRGVFCCWHLADRCPDGLILRDGVEYWTTESLWIPGHTPGRTYALRIDGVEYEFRRALRRRDPYSRNQRKSPERKTMKEAS